MAFKYGDITNCKVGNGTTRDEYECRLGWDYAKSQSESQSIENNNTKIKLRLQVRSINANYKTSGYNQTSTIDGTALSAKQFDMSDTNAWQTFGERTITISHKEDGTYSATKSGSFKTTATGTYSLKSGSAKVKVEPAQIPRASTPTLSSSNIILGNTVTINTNRKSDKFTHTIKYSFGNVNETIGTGIGASVNWTPPVGLANQIPDSASDICTITCETYNGTELIGTQSIPLTLTVPDTAGPIINSIILSEGGDKVPSNWGIYVQEKSKIKVEIKAQAVNGASISSYNVFGIDNKTYIISPVIGSDTVSFISTELQTAGTHKIIVEVTDSRGISTKKEKEYSCVEYKSPSISIANVNRCDADGTDNDEGTYIKYDFQANIYPLNNKNTYSYKLAYKQTDTSEQEKDIPITNNSYTINKEDVVVPEIIFDEDFPYDIRFVVKDYFEEVSNIQPLPTGFTLLDFNASGKAMAIGKVSNVGSDEKLLEIALPTSFNEKVTFGEDGEYEISPDGSTYSGSSKSIINIEKTDDVGANYYIPFFTGKNNNSAYQAHTNKGLSLYIENGSSDSNGKSILILGNDTNQYGKLRLFGKGAAYTDIETNASTANTNLVLPTVSGTVVVESEKSILTNDDGNSSYIVLGKLLICWGKVSITPSANDTPTSKAITFPKQFSKSPTMFTTSQTGVPRKNCYRNKRCKHINNRL